MSSLEELQKEVHDVQLRNARVEADKAWETSWTRRLLIAGLTYCVVVVFFFVADLPSPFINALVPTAGFVISTLTVRFCKQRWLQTRNKQ